MTINIRIAVIILAALILISGIFVGCRNQDTYDGSDSISILFVGNSHVRTGNVPGQLQVLAMMHGIEMTYIDVSRNGANLDGAMRDNAIREMQNRNFDYVVMQARGRSIRPADDIGGFLNDIRIFSEQIRDNGAIPVLYSPAWANINGQPNEELQYILTRAHKQAAYENDAILINAGDVWVYAYRAIPGLSLYARDAVHANHEGAFLTACVFAITLFDLRYLNITAGNVIDNLPMLNILTIVGFVVIALVIIYSLIKKQPLCFKKPLMVIVSLVLLQVMSFFPHVFIFIETGNRLLLLYLAGVCLFVVALFSIYCFIRIKFMKKQSWGAARKYIFYAIACAIIYILTFIPALELRSPIYRGDNAAALAQAAWSFVNSL